MKQHKAISWLVLGLIMTLTFASIGNIHSKIETYHESITSWLISIAFGIGLAVLVYAVVIAQSNRTRWTAALLSVVFGSASATLQVALYRDEGAAFWTAIALGVTVPLMEAALAIIEALLRNEITATDSATVAQELTASNDTLQATVHNLAERNQKLQAQVDSLRAVPVVDTLPSKPVSQPSKITDGKLSKADRQLSIYQKLMDVGTVNLTELTDEFGVSINTVKGDIKSIDGAELTGDGHAKYVNGVVK